MTSKSVGRSNSRRAAERSNGLGGNVLEKDDVDGVLLSLKLRSARRLRVFLRFAGVKCYGRKGRRDRFKLQELEGDFLFTFTTH